MTRAAVACLLLCTAASSSLAQQPPAPTLSIAGRVTAENDAVLPRVRVAVTVQGAQPSAVLTDERGRFALSLPDTPAPVRLTLTKAGYAAQTLDLARSDVAAARTRELQVRLARGAAISGQVVDQLGEPVVGSRVMAQPIEPPVRAGSQAIEFSTETDDRGEYRLGGLPAGRYAITVRAPSTDMRSAQRPENAATGVVTSAGKAGARTLDLVPGGAASADFRVDVASELTQGVGGRVPDPDPAATSSIGGRILGPSGRPIPGVVVRAMRTGFSIRAAETDAQGRYVIPGLTGGEYLVEARKSGYVTLQYGQRDVAQAGRPVAVRADTAVERIDITIPRGSAVTGTVVDDYGEPIAGASVRALQLRMAGDMTLAATAPGVRERLTDDQGRYRLFGLLPGRYLVSATLDAEVSSANRAEASGYAPVFYPGTSEVALASQLEIVLGAERAAIDLVFTRSPTARVTGMAFDTSGQPLKTRLLLFESQRSGNILLEPRTVGVGPDGSFVFANVPPGRYVVQAFLAANPGAPQPRGGTPAIDFGMQYVTVTDGDPAPIIVRTTSGSTVEGRIVKEGAAEPGARFSVYPFPSDFDQSPVMGSGPAGLTMLDDERFRVVGVTGPRRFTLGIAPPGWYLKSAVVNGADAADTPFDFGLEGEAFRDVEVVLSNNSASLSGAVTDDTGNPVSDYGVVVFSTDRAQWFRSSSRVTLARPNQTGAYAVDSLPPGDYFVVAVDRIDGTPGAGEWQSPALLDALSSRAIRITVTEGETRTSTLRLIKR